MILPMRTVLLSVIFLFVGFLGAQAKQGTGQDNPQCQHKTGSTPMDHKAMMERGEKGMGFSQTQTTHHFLLKSDGGVIAVSANDSKDSATRDQIRMHLSHIARSFAEGDFHIPMFVHDQMPPGVAVMKRLRRAIHYRFTPTDMGGQVVISSDSAEAVEAIHEFLSFQMQEHKTGDPLKVE
jgi:hypothetical protein